MKQRKAQFAEIDFFLAILILGLGLIVITAPFIHVKEDIQADRLSYDAVNILSTVKFKHLDASFQNDIRSNLTSFELSVSDDDSLTSIITKLLVKYDENDNAEIIDFANDIITKIFYDVIPERYKYEVMVLSGDEVFSIVTISDDEKTDIASQSRTLLSGLEVGRPISGFISTGYVDEARKIDSAYTFIGGFIGQGDLSFKLDVPSSDSVGVYLEGLFHDDFNFSVNGNICGRNIGAGFVDEVLDECIPHVTEDINYFDIKFLNDDLSKKYVSGGIIRVDYNISNVVSSNGVNTKTEKKYISGVDGVINIYDSFYVPGSLLSAKFYLNHDINISSNLSSDDHVPGFNDATLFMTVANETVYTNNASGQVFINDDISLSGVYENETIPFRIGFEEFTKIVQSSDPVDVIMVTDLSGSMWYNDRASRMINVNDFDLDTCGWDEDDEWFEYFNGELYVQRIAMAVCVNKLLIDELFENNDDVRMGVVGFGVIVYRDDIVNFTNDPSELIDFFDNMYDEGNKSTTCISCGIAAGINLFTQSSDDRKKIMIVMSDGEQNYKYNQNDPPPYGPIIRNYGTGTSGNDVRHTERFTDYFKNNQSGVIYAINFAAPTNAARELLRNIIASDDEIDDDGNIKTYYLQGSEPDDLVDIYKNLGSEISSGASYVAQTIEVDVSDFDVFESFISNSSYIEYTYVPYEDPKFRGKIKLSRENIFRSVDCHRSFSWEYNGGVIPGGGFVTSYSGNIWTSEVSVNNHIIFDVFDYSDNDNLGNLGDPFALGFPISLLNTNTNNLNINLHNGTGVINTCNEYNKLIYDVYYPSVFTTQGVQPKSDGCDWEVVGVGDISIPQDYSGSETCIFDPSDINSATYDGEDTLQRLGYEMLSGLTHDGELVIDFQRSRLVVSVSQLDDVPYLWGPALIGVTIWR